VDGFSLHAAVRVEARDGIGRTFLPVCGVRGDGREPPLGAAGWPGGVFAEEVVEGWLDGYACWGRGRVGIW